MLGQVSAEGWSMTGTPATEPVVKLQPPVLHECPSPPHKEKTLQFSGQSQSTSRAGGLLQQGHVLRLHTVTVPSVLMCMHVYVVYHYGQFPSGCSTI